MRVYVLRAYKLKPFLYCFRAVLAIFLVFTFAFYATGAFVSSDRYIESMHTASEKKTVILDAGHGGEDPGVVGVSGIYEKDLNLAFVFEIGAMLEERGYAVVYTRTEDKLLYKDDENIKGIRKHSDLKNRTAIANEYPSAIFVSIHMNSYSDSRYSGLQVYYGIKNELSRELAECIRASVKNEVQTENNRKSKQGNSMYLLENNLSPSVIVECGFLTNKEECEKLSEKEYQKSLCLAIVCGIIEYTEKVSEY